MKKGLRQVTRQFNAIRLFISPCPSAAKSPTIFSFMLVNYRHRRGMYYPAPEKSVRLRRFIFWGIVLLLVLYFIVSPILRVFGWGSSGQKLPVTLRVEDAGIVSVVLEGGKSQRAEDQMKLFPKEKVSTGPTGNAALLFFDSSVARLDGNTDTSITESVGGKSSSIGLALDRGTLWLNIPAASQALHRNITTPTLSYTFPSGSEVILSPSSLLVFHAGGAGVTVSFKGHSDITIGEGQQFVLPADLKTVSNDLYSYRTPLDLSSLTSPFLLASREKEQTITTSVLAPSSTGSDILTVTQPTDGTKISGDSVTVNGRVGSGVLAVNVNGHPAVLSNDTHAFTQELSLPAGDTFAITVQALDSQGNALMEIHRTVTRGASASGATVIAAPTITEPAKSGETYRTAQTDVVLRGTSPSNAATIYVNDYQLKLFDPSRGTWSYLASLRLGNMQRGLNVFDVHAEDAAGNKSPSSRITILSGPGPEGVVSSASSATVSSPSSLLNPHTLPNNAPLTPGMLHITGAPVLPDFIATGTGFLLEGQTSAKTASMWVNGYQLRLYTPGKTFWNYLATPSLGTIKPGNNVYHIVARDAQGNILDLLDFSTTYRK